VPCRFASAHNRKQPIRVLLQPTVAHLREAALLRFIAALLLVPTTIGIFWAMVDRDGQFLHDRLAGSLLVKA
jgi:uncharacterized RDD family membrane protein YckC